MKKEELTKLGIDEAVADQIIVLHGKDIEKFKTAVETTKSENEGLKAQLTEAGETIEGFKKLDIDGIKKAADEYKSAAEKAAADGAAQIASLKFEHALDGALIGAKAKNAKAVRALLKTDDLKLAEDGSLVGLTEQLDKVRKENDFLFESDGVPPKIVTGAHNKTIIGDAVVAAARKAAGLSDAKE